MNKVQLKSYSAPILPKLDANQTFPTTPHKKMFKKTPRKLLNQISSMANGVKKNILKDTKESKRNIFGQPLAKIMNPSGELPKPIMELLRKLKDECPDSQVGIFRKGCNTRLIREWKQKINACPKNIDFDELSTLESAALLANFLHSLPDCLLTSALYSEWIDLSSFESVEADQDEEAENAKFAAYRRVLAKLPKENLKALKCFLRVFHSISLNADIHRMTSTNLATCIRVSMLFNADLMNPQNITDKSSLKNNLQQKESVTVITYLIDNCIKLFGQEVRTILDEQTFSNSLHSAHYNASSKLSLESRISSDSGFGGSTYSCSSLNISESSLFSRRRNISATTLKSHDSGLDIEASYEDIASPKLSLPMTSYKQHKAVPTRFQRNEWMRRRSVIRKTTRTCHRKSLVRASSEESILNKIISNDQTFDLVMTQLAELSLDKRNTTTASKDSGLTLSMDEDEPDFQRSLNLGSGSNTNFVLCDEPLCSISMVLSPMKEPVSALVAKSKFQRKSWTRDKSRTKLFYKNIVV